MANVANSAKTSYIIEVIDNGKTFGTPFEFLAVNDTKAVKEGENFTANLSKVLGSTLKVSIKIKGESEPFSMTTCKFIEPVKEVKDTKKAVKA